MGAPQRAARIKRIREWVRHHDVVRWISAQLQDIRDLTTTGRSLSRRGRAGGRAQGVPEIA